MTAYTLSGSGIQALSPGTQRLSVVVSNFGSGYSTGLANPTNYYHLGMLRLGISGAFYPTVPLDAATQLLDVPPGANQLGYAMTNTQQITVTELFNVYQPFPAGGRHVSGLNFNVTLPVSSANTTLLTYTVPAGRSALVEGLYLAVGLSNTNATVVVNVNLAGDGIYYNNLNGPLQGPQALGYYPVLQGIGNLRMNAGENVIIQCQNLSSTNQVGVLGSGIVLEYPQPMW